MAGKSITPSRLSTLISAGLRVSLVLALCVQIAPGQTSKASLSGIVTDSSGAVISGAGIKVTDLQRNVTYEAQTNQTGFYLVSELIPGSYRVTAEMPGFRGFVLEPFPLSTQQKATVNITLEVGAVTERVEVTGAAQLIESSSATLSAVVENKKIIDLPLANRNVYVLMRLVPGVTPATPNSETDMFTGAHRYSINGGLEATTDVQLDGVSALAQSDLPGLLATSVLPSVESIQEFRVQTNAYSAEYGRSGGGMVTMVTRSGTNDFHGTLFEFLRNKAMDSNNFFANSRGAALPPLKQNQFGGSLGGPVFKNRTFFFGFYEGRRLNLGNFQQFTVPTERERRGDFSETRNSAGQLRVVYDPFTTRPNPDQPGRFVRSPFPNNIIPPTRMDPVAVKAMSYYPNPNQPGLPFTNQLNLGIFASGSFPTDRFGFKVDHDFSERHRSFLRYNRHTSDAAAWDHWGNGATPTPGLLTWGSHNAAVDYTQTIGTATVLNLRGGFNRFHAFRPSFSFGFDPSKELGMPAYVADEARRSSVLKFPEFSLEDYSQMGPPAGAYFISDNTDYTGMGSISQVRGRHTLKGGFDIRFYFLGMAQVGGPMAANFTRAMTQGPDPRVPSATAGNGMASFLLGTASGGSQPHTPKPANANRYFAWYVQDDIKASRKLTLNLGFRLEFETGTTERYNRLTAMDPFVRNPISDKVGFDVHGGFLFAGGSLGRRAIRPVETKPNPRVGLAYQWDDKTVIRSGYGIFFGVPHFGATNGFTGTPFFSSTSFLATLDGITPYRLLRDPFPDGYTLPAGSAPGLLAGIGFGLYTGWPETLRTAYNQQWNFAIQRSLGSGVVLEIAYAGNKATRLEAFECCSAIPNMNQIRPELMRPELGLLDLVPNPFFGIIQGGALGQAQIQRGQLLRPFPAWGNVLPKSTAWGNSNYHSLQARFERRFSRGTSLLAAYTWSKTIADFVDGRWNDAQFNYNGPIRNWYCLSCERSVSSYDIPHRLVVNFTYELPFGKGKTLGSKWSGVTNAFLGGWQTNGIFTINSGQPLVIRLAQNTSHSFGGGQQVNSTGVDPNLGRDKRSITRWFDTSQFTAPAEYTFGNLGRTLTTVRSDFTRTFDFSMFKNFAIVERLQLQFRAEAYNLSNTPIFAPPNTTFGSGAFGVVSSQANSPRQIQLGLKLLF